MSGPILIPRERQTSGFCQDCGHDMYWHGEDGCAECDSNYVTVRLLRKKQLLFLKEDYPENTTFLLDLPVLLLPSEILCLSMTSTA